MTKPAGGYQRRVEKLEAEIEQLRIERAAAGRRAMVAEEKDKKFKGAVRNYLNARTMGLPAAELRYIVEKMLEKEND